MIDFNANYYAQGQTLSNNDLTADELLMEFAEWLHVQRKGLDINLTRQ